MKNGRCYLHGGKTPSGSGWHRPVWPNKAAPNASAKLAAKLQALRKAERVRKARLARMTDPERARYDEWHRRRPAGDSAARAAERARREQNDWARRVMAAADCTLPDVDPDMAALAARIEVLKAQLDELRGASLDDPTDIDPNKEIFG